MRKRSLIPYTCLFLAAALIPVSANSALKFWRGSSGNGAVSSDRDCPLTVEHEDLSFYISDVPDAHYEDAVSLEGYQSYVQADYIFYNPTDMTVTSRLVFPFGELPSYVHFREGMTDAKAYSALVNGVPVATRLRCTWQNGDFDVTRDVAKLSDEPYDDPFYRPDLPVTCFVFRAEGLPDSDSSAMAFSLPPDPRRTRILLEPANTWRDGEVVTTGAFINNGETVKVWFFGDVPDEFPAWQAYTDLSLEKKSEGEMIPVSKEEMTFRDYAFLDYDPASQITENDWYNICISLLNAHITRDGLITELPQHFAGSLMRWYDYEITLAPGEELVNTVKAPVYPSRDESYEDFVYGYTYLLSPASTWSSFGTLDIRIFTDLYMTDHDETFAFEETDGGYQLWLEELPDRELTFSLSASAYPKHTGDRTLMIILGILLAAALAALLLIILVIRLIIRLFRKKA